MTKEKNAPILHREYSLKRLLKIAPGIVGFFICGALGCGLITYAYMSIGEIRISIDPALLATAEYLYEHPQPLPDFIRFDASQAPKSLCYEAVLSFWTQIFLNGARMPLNAFYTRIPRGPLDRDPSPGRGTFCLNDRELLPGLHLAEIHWRQNLLDEPIIYQWAMKVEE